MLKLGDKVRLKVAKQSVPIPFTDKRVDIDTDQTHTVTQVNTWDGDDIYVAGKLSSHDAMCGALGHNAIPVTKQYTLF